MPSQFSEADLTSHTLTDHKVSFPVKAAAHICLIPQSFSISKCSNNSRGRYMQIHFRKSFTKSRPHNRCVQNCAEDIYSALQQNLPNTSSLKKLCPFIEYKRSGRRNHRNQRNDAVSLKAQKIHLDDYNNKDTLGRSTLPTHLKWVKDGR